MTTYASRFDPLIRYRVTGTLVEMRVGAGEYLPCGLSAAQIGEAWEAGRLGKL